MLYVHTRLHGQVTRLHVLHGSVTRLHVSCGQVARLHASLHGPVTCLHV